MLSPPEFQRYQRQMILPELGLAGQAKLKAASVLVVGVGGLGSPVALYLAAAGIGRLGLVDFDTVDASNLHRQILHGAPDVGRPKLDVAVEQLYRINPHIQLERHDMRLTKENALSIIGDYDIVADGTDNFATRYLVNDACVLTGTPNVYASIFRFEGQVSVFGTADGPCYRCLYPVPPPPDLVPSCAEGGVLGVLPGIVGTVQATEVIKALTGIGEPLMGRMLMVNALSMQFEILHLPRDPHCPVCGDTPTITALLDYDQHCGVRQSALVPEISVADFQHARVQPDAPVVLDVRTAAEYAIAHLNGLHIPLDELPDRVGELRDFQDQPMVVYCRSGARSAKAVQALHAQGFAHAVNLKGGLLAWAAAFDSKVHAALYAPVT